MNVPFATDAAPVPLFDGPLPSAAALAAVESHPGFPDAMRAVAAGSVTLYRGNRLLNALVTDRGRFLVSIFAVHLHVSARAGDPLSGLTTSRMQAICAEQKICSPGRVEAMLGLMRVFGHLASAPSDDDRRLRRLAPTERLYEWHRERCRFTFAALAHVMPLGGEALAALPSDRFLERFLSRIAERYLGGLYYVDHVPDMRFFLERNAGIVAIFSLLLAGERDDTFPPQRPAAVSLSRLARNFGVSRAHLRRMFSDCVDAGLLFRSGEEGEAFEISPRLAHAISRCIALYLLHNADGARAALEQEASISAVA